MFERKGKYLYYKGKQITIRCQASFLGSTWTNTMKFPMKRMNMDSLPEQKLCLIEQAEDIMKMEVNDVMVSKVYRDSEKNNLMLITRLA